jgi:hypothetical protein
MLMLGTQSLARFHCRLSIQDVKETTTAEWDRHEVRTDPDGLPVLQTCGEPAV